jgi:hypothetical protein
MVVAEGMVMKVGMTIIVDIEAEVEIMIFFFSPEIKRVRECLRRSQFEN